MPYEKLEMLRQQILFAIDETGDHTHPQVLALSEEMDRLLNVIMGIGEPHGRNEGKAAARRTRFRSQETYQSVPRSSLGNT